MRRSIAALVVGGVILAAGCSGEGTAPVDPPSLHRSGPTSPPPCNADRSEALIRELFPKSDDREAAMSRFGQLLRLAGSTPPGNKPQATRNQALRLVDYVLRKFHAGHLNGGTSTATAQKTAELLTGILCLAGLPPFDPAALGLDGAAQVVFPNSPQTTIVTGTGFAGTQINTGSVTEPTLITIQRLPNAPGPLLTQFDQYPLFYEFHHNPGTAFTIPVVVVACTSATIEPPDPSRLRLAHNVAPFTMGSIEILEPVPAEFVDCTTAGLAAAPSRGRLHELARGGFRLLKTALEKTVLPQPLFAARYFGTGGLSGSVRTFSPFGGVDPVGIMTPNDDFTRGPNFGELVEVVPAVTLTTPTGRPLVGFDVTWTVTSGGGSVGNPLIATDANGFASAGSWRFGFVNPQTLTATAVAPAGISFVGSPFVFNGIGH